VGAAVGVGSGAAVGLGTGVAVGGGAVGVGATVGEGSGVAVGVGVGSGGGVGVAVAGGLATENTAVTVAAEPVEGLKATVALYVPIFRPAVWTEKITRVEEFAGIVPFDGVMESQAVEAGAACHERELPPVLEMVID